MIRADRVTVRIGSTTILDRVSLHVRVGEVLALFGANGAGKSTLLAALAGDRKPTAGTIALRDRDIAQLRPHELAMQRAVLRQRTHLAAGFTVEQVVRLGRDDPAIARACLAEVELDRFAARRYPSLSGGEQQRVQLARILAQVHGRRDTAILLDEPGAALDLRQQKLLERLTRTAASRGHAVVLVAHDPQFVARCADRVAVLHAGALIADGSPAILAPDLLARTFDLPA